MKIVSSVIIAAVAGGLLGCALVKSEEARYLCQAQDRATQADIRQRLGEPVLTASRPEGQIWVYEVRTVQGGSRINPAGTWCEQFVLTFDRERIMRHWTQKTQFHGGETQPAYCVTDGFRPAL